MTSIGIIGAGQIGRAIATALARHAIPATLANSRGPGSLAETVAALGPSITAGTREEAAAKDIVIVAVNWSKLPAALASLPDFGGRIVVDANNPIEAPLFKPFDLGARSSSEVLAGLVPGARVVKAFNHLRPDLISGDPADRGGRRVLFHAGDDTQAKAEVGALIDRLGFFGIDLGMLAVGGRLVQFPGGPLSALDLVKFG
jgi:predicted dinucleotide-binding enzyme